MQLVENKKYFKYPKVINVELTTSCPIRCPQCYKSEFDDKSISYDHLVVLLSEAKTFGTKVILLSGGEPLQYEKIVDVVEFISSQEMYVAISTSGIYFDDKLLVQLKKKGLNTLYVSLNGSSEHINQTSREGYHDAIKTIKNAVGIGLECKLNWVARHDNIYDLRELISFAKDIGVSGIDVLSNKPTSKGEINSILDEQDYLELISVINEDNEKYLNYQQCFLELDLRMLGEKNFRYKRGCSAGVYSMAIKADGSFAPCPHFTESTIFDSIKSYWNNDCKLIELRESVKLKNSLCSRCYHSNQCKTCTIIQYNRNHCLKFQEIKDEI